MFGFDSSSAMVSYLIVGRLDSLSVCVELAPAVAFQEDSSPSERSYRISRLVLDVVNAWKGYKYAYA